MWKSPENDAMPCARESPDKDKTNHKYKDKIPQKSKVYKNGRPKQ